ncbi:hypothetical protein E6H31_05005 [Candidatus Bathyarchaeota archaeon]|nr:MAG: hypothetical protein E6H31_05005 [Candidatus Bathyarchaeota archaeon]
MSFLDRADIIAEGGLMREGHGRFWTNLSRFDERLCVIETIVKKNYVEKYYHLDQKFFEALDPSEQRRRIRTARPEELKTILQSTLASLGLDFRLLAEEVARADDKIIEQIARSVAEERITLSYSILPDKAFEYVLAELKRINKTVLER